MTQIAFELSGSALRDIGISRAQDHAEDSAPGWTASVLRELRAFCDARKAAGKRAFRFEEFREVCQSPPVTHKAWGSIPRAAAKHGLITRTGRFVPAHSVKTHGHPVREYIAL